MGGIYLEQEEAIVNLNIQQNQGWLLFQES